MTVGTILSLTFNLAMLCGATPARMNVALLFSEPASWGVFIYDASTHATLFSSGFPSARSERTLFDEALNGRFSRCHASLTV